MVRALQPPPDWDMAHAWRDERAFASLLRPTLGARLHPDAESVIVMPGNDPRNPRNLHRGLDGFRQAWLEWVSPWETYHVVEIEDIVDLGESALVLVRDRGRMRGMSADVDLRGAAIWTVRDGLVIRAEFYADRHQAFDVAGLTPDGGRADDDAS